MKIISSLQQAQSQDRLNALAVQIPYAKFLGMSNKELVSKLEQGEITPEYVRSLEGKLKDAYELIASQKRELELWQKLEDERKKE